MRLIVPATLLTFTWLCAASAQAQICKWVDGDGVTHYSTECPEEGGADVLDIDTKPVDEPGDDARPAAPTEDDFAPLEPGPGAEAEIALAPPETSVLQDDEVLERCVRATTNLIVLQAQAPVFYDDQNNLHHGWSARARAYEGPRTYIDDEDRDAEIRQYERYLAENCGRSEAERERIAELAMAQRLQLIQDEVCADRQYLLNRLNGGLTGLPSPSVRELQAYIRANCN